jgi:RNA recognition motif-containing protein
MTVRLYVGNLPEEVDRQALEDLFTSAGEIVSTKVIRDRKTGKCRGFGFLTVKTPELADQYIEKFNGHPFGDSSLKIELAQPRSKTETGSEGEGEGIVAKEQPQRSEASTASSGSGKKRNRGRTQSSQGQSSSSQSAPTGPDPRWASDLQRIKEQLQAANL